MASESGGAQVCDTGTESRGSLWNEAPEGVRAPYPKDEGTQHERVSRDT